MDCLKGFIGIRGCGNTAEPASGRYINELPGISLRNLEAIANADQVTFMGVWADIEARGIDRLKSRVTAYLKQRYQLKKVLDYQATPNRIGQAFAGTGMYRGLTIKTAYTGSKMLGLHVQEFSVYASAPAAGVPVKVVNLETGKELYSGTKDLVEGWNKVWLNKGYQTGAVFVGYLDTGVNTAHIELPTDNTGSCACDCYWEALECTVEVNGATLADPADITTLDEGADTFGVTAKVGLHCDYDQFVCANLDIFTTALMASCGIAFCLERIHSDRVNAYTRIDVKKAEELLQTLVADFDYEMEQALDSIELGEDCCVQCTQFIQEKWMHP